MPIKIIAESGVDHEGSSERAFRLLDAASKAGADFFKTQYYKKGLMGPNRELPWLSEDTMISLMQHCQSLGIYFLVTPHDEYGLAFVKELGLRDVKIGSGGWNILNAINQDRIHNPNLIVSTGMKNKTRVQSLFNALQNTSGFHTVMHCISEYPCPPQRAQLGFIRWMMEATKDIPHIQIGYSDHTEGTAIPLAAAGMGVQMIEKHLTLEMQVEGRQDTFCSLNPNLFRFFVNDVRAVDAAMAPKPDHLRIVTEGEKATQEWIEARGGEA